MTRGLENCNWQQKAMPVESTLRVELVLKISAKKGGIRRVNYPLGEECALADVNYAGVVT